MKQHSPEQRRPDMEKGDEEEKKDTATKKLHEAIKDAKPGQMITLRGNNPLKGGIELVINITLTDTKRKTIEGGALYHREKGSDHFEAGLDLEKNQDDQFAIILETLGYDFEVEKVE